MNIDWAALGQVFGVSLVVTVAMVGVFTLGIVGTSAKPSRDAATGAAGTAGGSGALARSGAYACFALCAAAVAYGIYLIVA
ncbi:hypothetical protein [Streptomyces buecherae]|uniref:Uncharacterized protein n=1 Tax=Streptomyces buecherae TaxID=2763006 RepID=A0A7G8KJ79_9ACTN|nr:hypothetical protein [Streptomyces buecherae]MBC3986143.1 hypothetical protein [Streptomyces buecherae]MBC3990962.1 hypothetical protein [Streptomyces buecherae]QKW49256.1 hypothetical protein HUT08_06540 [Streptomyces buecherae]QNJ43112.1 hypothetical protein H7H31_28035 [Streptomyces buecherae]